MGATGEIDAVTFEELQRLARSHPRSGRQAQAKASAIRTRNGWLGMGVDRRSRRVRRIGIRCLAQPGRSSTGQTWRRIQRCASGGTRRGVAEGDGVSGGVQKLGPDRPKRVRTPRTRQAPAPVSITVDLSSLRRAASGGEMPTPTSSLTAPPGRNDPCWCGSRLNGSQRAQASGATGASRPSSTATSVSTTSGSNCVPLQRRSSASASWDERAGA